jgi:hypothetical protein
MTPIRPQMRGDTMRTGAFAEAGDCDGIGFGIFRIGHRGIPNLAKSGDVIDIYA